MVTDRKVFEGILDDAAKRAGIKLTAPVRKAILNALAERNETETVCLGRDGKPEEDPELRDTERVPLAEDVTAFTPANGSSTGWGSPRCGTSAS